MFGFFKTFQIGGRNKDAIGGTDGNDLVFSGGGADIIDTGEGDDLIFSGSGDDVVNSGEGHDLVFAGSGNDFIFAGEGDDLVFAGSGDDIIDVGSGNDVASGGSGADRFIVTAETEGLVITDFELGVDVLDVTALKIEGNPLTNPYYADMEMLDGDTVISYIDAETQDIVATITLLGVSDVDLKSGDFMF